MFRRFFKRPHKKSADPQRRPPIPKAEIREYVEAELEHILRAHPDLKLSKGAWYMYEDDEDIVATTKNLVWTIWGSGSDYVSDYMIEARVEQGELLIWFGYSSAGAGGVHQNMVSAVHLHLGNLKAEWSPYHRPMNVYPLSAVLDRMLRLRGELVDITYPMNCRCLT